MFLELVALFSLLSCFNVSRSKGFGAETKVSVRIDLNQRHVAFGINDVWLEPTFTRINDGKYYPYFFLGLKDKKVTVLK